MKGLKIHLQDPVKLWRLLLYWHWPRVSDRHWLILLPDIGQSFKEHWKSELEPKAETGLALRCRLGASSEPFGLGWFTFPQGLGQVREVSGPSSCDLAELSRIGSGVEVVRGEKTPRRARGCEKQR